MRHPLRCAVRGFAPLALKSPQCWTIVRRSLSGSSFWQGAALRVAGFNQFALSYFPSIEKV
jgi:hypothetical protein